MYRDRNYFWRDVGDFLMSCAAVVGFILWWVGIIGAVGLIFFIIWGDQDPLAIKLFCTCMISAVIGFGLWAVSS